MPLFINTGKKKIKRNTIAMNQYRNWHYLVSNNIKKQYKELVKEQLDGIGLDFTTPIALIFTYFNPTKRKSDVTNFCCIHDKFFSDAIVEL